MIPILIEGKGVVRYAILPNKMPVSESVLLGWEIVAAGTAGST